MLLVLGVLLFLADVCCLFLFRDDARVLRLSLVVVYMLYNVCKNPFVAFRGIRHYYFYTSISLGGWYGKYHFPTISLVPIEADDQVSFIIIIFSLNLAPVRNPTYDLIGHDH